MRQNRPIPDEDNTQNLQKSPGQTKSDLERSALRATVRRTSLSPTSPRHLPDIVGASWRQCYVERSQRQFYVGASWRLCNVEWIERRCFVRASWRLCKVFKMEQTRSSIRLRLPCLFSLGFTRAQNSSLSFFFQSQGHRKPLFFQSRKTKLSHGRSRTIV